MHISRLKTLNLPCTQIRPGCTSPKSLSDTFHRLLSKNCLDMSNICRCSIFPFSTFVLEFQGPEILMENIKPKFNLITAL